MPHTVTYNPELHIIETKTQGEVTLDESRMIISKVIQTAVEKNCFLRLSDYREEILNLSTLEIYNMPKIISDMCASAGISASKFKRAVVVKRDLADFRFFANVTLNNGQTIKLFDDLEEARKWLLETQGQS